MTNTKRPKCLFLLHLAVRPVVDGFQRGDERRAALETFVQTLENPFGVPVEFRLLDAKEHGLSSSVIAGAETYLAAKVRREPHFEIAWGYSFETA